MYIINNDNLYNLKQEHKQNMSTHTQQENVKKIQYNNKITENIKVHISQVVEYIFLKELKIGKYNNLHDTAKEQQHFHDAVWLAPKKTLKILGYLNFIISRF